MGNKLTFTVIGGDRRQLETIYILLDRGHRVKALGFDSLKDPRVDLFTKVETELLDCQVLLLPIPCRDKEGYINIKDSPLKVLPEELMEAMEGHRPLVVLGKADPSFRALALTRGLDYMDLIEEESFSILNAIPTAEGAIQRAMEMTDITIHGSKVLVLGYGRIGKSLSRMLKGIGAKVTVEARKEEDLAWIAENGYNGIHLRDLDQVLPHQDIIFNTIPHLILDRGRLEKVKKTGVIIDVSSHPGGIDFVAAKELGLKASLDLGLPGIIAPKTAAEIIYKVTMERLGAK